DHLYRVCGFALLVALMFGLFAGDALFHIQSMAPASVILMIMTYTVLIMGSLLPIRLRGLRLRLLASECGVRWAAFARALRDKLHGPRSAADRELEQDQSMARPTVDEQATSPRFRFSLRTVLGSIALWGLLLSWVRTQAFWFFWYLATNSLIGLGVLCGLAFSLTRRFGPAIEGRCGRSVLR